MDNTTGTLLVQVYTSRAELPVRDATVVVIRRAPSGKYELISIQSTDSSGMTKPITVETPPLLESTEPNNIPGPPFAQCDIWAEHPNYAMLLVEGVQVFPGVQTIQSMKLCPLSGAGSSLTDQCGVWDIPPQNL